MLDVNELDVILLEHQGYIFNRKENKIITPGRKTISAIERRIFAYVLTIVNDIDPLVQMNLLGRKEEAILIRTLKQFNGLKFNTSMEIECKKN